MGKEYEDNEGRRWRYKGVKVKEGEKKYDAEENNFVELQRVFLAVLVWKLCFIVGGRWPNSFFKFSRLFEFYMAYGK